MVRVPSDAGDYGFPQRHQRLPETSGVRALAGLCSRSGEDAGGEVVEVVEDESGEVGSGVARHPHVESDPEGGDRGCGDEPRAPVVVGLVEASCGDAKGELLEAGEHSGHPGLQCWGVGDEPEPGRRRGGCGAGRTGHGP